MYVMRISSYYIHQYRDRGLHPFSEALTIILIKVMCYRFSWKLDISHLPAEPGSDIYKITWARRNLPPRVGWKGEAGWRFSLTDLGDTSQPGTSAVQHSPTRIHSSSSFIAHQVAESVGVGEKVHFGPVVHRAASPSLTRTCHLKSTDAWRLAVALFMPVRITFFTFFSLSFFLNAK